MRLLVILHSLCAILAAGGVACADTDREIDKGTARHEGCTTFRMRLAPGEGTVQGLID